MDFQMLLAPLGIAFLVALSWLLGGRRNAGLTSDTEALDRFSEDYPSIEILECLLDGEGQSALLDTGTGRIGVVFHIGDKFGTRFWKSGDLESVVEKDLGLHIQTNDLSLPSLDLSISDAKTRQYWVRMLKMLVSSEEDRSAA